MYGYAIHMGYCFSVIRLLTEELLRLFTLTTVTVL